MAGLRHIVWTAAFLTAFGFQAARADVFPDQPYFGMQLDYQVEGIVLTGFDDRETPRTVTRMLEGVLTANKVRIKGVAYSVEDKSEVILTISAGPDMKKDSVFIKPQQGHKDFSIEIEVPPKARGSHISVLINPETGGKNLVKALRLDITAVPKR
ncbi:MAG: hypothetical protein EPN26_07620 [Rhodospirillales bacterium]|nr:MAG: hypothetical protein EPN26_07620 [Rhodospirillales bacterium]